MSLTTTYLQSVDTRHAFISPNKRANDRENVRENIDSY